MFIKINKDTQQLNTNEIDDFEKKYKLLLPKDYKNFLLTNNDNEMEENYKYYFNDKIYGSEINSPWFFPLSHIINNWKLVLEEAKDEDFTWKDLYKNKIVSFANDGLTQIELGISLGKKNNGYIYIIDREYVYDPPFIFLEKSFTDFINSFVKKE